MSQPAPHTLGGPLRASAPHLGVNPRTFLGVVSLGLGLALVSLRVERAAGGVRDGHPCVGVLLGHTHPI